MGYSKEYYQRNKEQYGRRSKKYYEAHKDRICAYGRERHARLKSDPEYAERLKKNSRSSYLRCRDKSLKWHKEHWLKMRLELIQGLGGKCIKCDYSDYRALQVDHVFGGGVKELKANKNFKSPRRYLQHILENRERYQLLCANCNWIKRDERGEHAKTRKAA